jgi:hypothetical protein
MHFFLFFAILAKNSVEALPPFSGRVLDSMLTQVGPSSRIMRGVQLGFAISLIVLMSIAVLIAIMVRRSRRNSDRTATPYDRPSNEPMSDAQVNEYFEALTQFTFNEKFHFSRTVEFRENRIQKLLENLALIPTKESVAYCECGNTFSPNINATVKLGWTWRCTGQRGCSKYTSPLKDTHFGSSSLSFFDDLQLIYCFTEGMSVTKAIETTKTKERTHGCRKISVFACRL